MRPTVKKRKLKKRLRWLERLYATVKGGLDGVEDATDARLEGVALRLQRLEERPVPTEGADIRAIRAAHEERLGGHDTVLRRHNASIKRIEEILEIPSPPTGMNRLDHVEQRVARLEYAAEPTDPDDPTPPGTH